MEFYRKYVYFNTVTMVFVSQQSFFFSLNGQRDVKPNAGVNWGERRTGQLPSLLESKAPAVLQAILPRQRYDTLLGWKHIISVTFRGMR